MSGGNWLARRPRRTEHWSIPTYVVRTFPAHGEPNQEIAWLCKEEWDLRIQAEALTEWLEANVPNLPQGNYRADIGFCWHRDACGGGAVLESRTLQRMAEVGMDLFLSEYSGFSDEE